jgi:hypothetical protein
VKTTTIRVFVSRAVGVVSVRVIGHLQRSISRPLWFDMPRDDWAAVAILIAVDVAPLIVLDDGVIDMTTLKRCIEWNARQMLHVARVKIVKGLGN